MERTNITTGDGCSVNLIVDSPNGSIQQKNNQNKLDTKAMITELLNELVSEKKPIEKYDLLNAANEEILNIEDFDIQLEINSEIDKLPKPLKKKLKESIDSLVALGLNVQVSVIGSIIHNQLFGA